MYDLGSLPYDKVYREVGYLIFFQSYYCYANKEIYYLVYVTRGYPKKISKIYHLKIFLLKFKINTPYP